jgi:hypothetical protein
VFAQVSSQDKTLSRDGTIGVRYEGMSSQITNPNTEAAILSRVIQFEEQDLSRGAAEYLLSIRFGGNTTLLA